MNKSNDGINKKDNTNLVLFLHNTKLNISKLLLSSINRDIIEIKLYVLNS